MKAIAGTDARTDATSGSTRCPMNRNTRAEPVRVCRSSETRAVLDGSPATFRIAVCAALVTASGRSWCSSASSGPGARALTVSGRFGSIGGARSRSWRSWWVSRPGGWSRGARPAEGSGTTRSLGWPAPGARRRRAGQAGWRCWWGEPFGLGHREVSQAARGSGKLGRVRRRVAGRPRLRATG